MMASGKKWRESDTIRFVELYEKSECLWNFRHPVYKNRNARDQAIQHIIKEMNLPGKHQCDKFNSILKLYRVVQF